MSYDGNGNFLPLPSPTFPAVVGAVIYADYFNLNMKNVHDGLSVALPRDGQAAMTGNLRMAGFQVKEVGAGSVAGDLVEWKQWTDTFLNSTYQVLNVPNLTGTPAGIRVPNLNWVNARLGEIPTAEILTLSGVTAPLQGQINGLQAQIDLRAPLSGGTYSGAHNFTAATVTVKNQVLGTSNTEAANTAFVMAAVQTYAVQQLIASSTTSVTTGPGLQSFVIEVNKAFTNGMYLSATSVGAPTNRMTGTVVSYNSSTGALDLLVDSATGTATRADWAIGVAAAGGTQLTPYLDISTNTSAVAFGRYRLTASLELTLPSTPTDGMWVDVVNHSGTISAKIMRNGQDIEGFAEDMLIDRNYIPFRLTFKSGYGWFLV